ncbi:inter-alpha-trypsin inhibitor heavy chain H3-like isoform X3 [Planococcus citri]|uniref:inter-alpha-trypsin inhibitor heavy chain H3-like isoform X3 n=1 Tax=Planococcus citri TaxID=170843 RepID=UPI0031FA1761
MLTLRKLAISTWLLLCLTSFVVCVPMSHVLKIKEENLIRERRDVTETSTKPAKNDTKPNISSFTVTSNIKYRYATTVVSNRVANPADVAQEIAFTVTLPDAAFISGFLMQIKDKVYEAYVKEKEEAKKDYQEAVDRGETAGHVELSARDSNVFTVSVNVEPLSKVTFNLTYEQLLARTLGLYENIINVNPGQIVKNMAIEVNIDESSNITVLQVPDLKTSNEIDSTDTKNKLATIEQSGKTGKVTWSPNTEQQQQLSNSGVKGQFIVRYDVDRVSNPNQILLDEGYFVHFYAPSDLKTLNKHVLFALDISGSMGGRKIEQLREALVQILGDIGEGDYFSLILFSDSVQLWTLNGTVGEASPTWYYNEERTTPTPDIEISERFIIPATKENIDKAKVFAQSLNETGGTNIIAALRKSLQIAHWGQKEFSKNAKPLIIFLTDGQPNVEMSDTDEIVKTVKKLNVDKYPLFSLAFGQGADYDFLRKLSLSNSGFARNIYVASDTHLQLKNFYKEVASPLLSNVSFDYVAGQISNETLTKSVFNNLFNGSELVVAGRLAGGAKTINGNLTGQSSNGFFCIEILPPIIIDHELHPVNKTRGHLEKLWAYLYIKELLDKDLLSDEKNSTYKQKALKLSLEYSFVTPLTSLVVRKPNETSNADVHNQQNPESPDLASSSAQMMLPSLQSYSYAYASPSSLAQPANRIGGTSLKVSANYLNSAVGLRGPGNLYYASAAAPGLPAPMSAGNSFPLHQVLRTSVNPSAGVKYKSTTYNPTTTTSYPNSFLVQEEPIETTFIAEADSDVLLNITDIAWLKNVTDIKFPSSNNTYSVGQSDLPNTEFQTCLLPNSNNTLGHCRHLAHCVIREIISTFEDFVPYGEQCVIDARFVGICCPNKFIPKPQNTTTEAFSTTTTVPTTSHA